MTQEISIGIEAIENMKIGEVLVLEKSLGVKND